MRGRTLSMADNQGHGAVYVNTSRLVRRGTAFLVVWPTPPPKKTLNQTTVLALSLQGIWAAPRSSIMVQFSLRHSPSVGSVTVYHWEVPFCEKNDRSVCICGRNVIWDISTLSNRHLYIYIFLIYFFVARATSNCNLTGFQTCQLYGMWVCCVWCQLQATTSQKCCFELKILPGWPWLFSDFSRPQPILVPIRKLGSKRNSDIF